MRNMLSGAGSLRKEIEAVVDGTSPDTNLPDYRRLIIDENVAGKGSAASRLWAWKRLKLRYVLDPQVAEYATFRNVLRRTHDPGDRGLISYLMLSRTHRLFREVVLEQIVPQLDEPGTLVEPLVIRQAIEERALATDAKWTESVMQGETSHTLSALKDYGLLTGSARKRIARVRARGWPIVFAACLGRLEGLSDRRNLESRWFALLGHDLDRTVDSMFEAARAGLLQFRFQADVAEIGLPSLGEAA